MWIPAFGLTAAAALFSFSSLKPPLFRPPAQAPPPSASPARIVPLSLRFTHGKDVVLTWNANATAVQTAIKASLFIRDGERQEDVALNLEMLRTGRIQYQPLTPDVGFRLTLTDAAGRETVALGAGDRLAAPDTPVVADQETAIAPGPEQPSAAPARAFVLPAIGTHEPEVPEPPMLAGNPALPETARLVPPRQIDAPKPAAPKPAVPAREPQRSMTFSQPELLRQVKPVYPELAMRNHINGAVRLRISITPEGRVSEAEALSGAPVFRKPAIEAAKQWVYKPALRDGEPTPYSLEVTVTFVAFERTN